MVKNNENRNTFVYVTDDFYAMPSCVSAFSLIKNKMDGEKIRIYFFLNGVEQSKKDRLNKLNQYEDVEVILTDLSEAGILEKMAVVTEIVNKHVTRTDLFKLYLSELLPDEKRVVYIDGDTIIQDSLSELFHMNLEGKTVAAAVDIFLNNESKRLRMYNLQWARDIGNRIDVCFNSGMMVLELETMRKNRITDQLVSFWNHEKNYFPDQDAYNVVCNQSKVILENSYNFQTNILEWYLKEDLLRIAGSTEDITVDKMLQQKKVLHFSGGNKPWEYDLPWITDIFMRYYIASPFSDVKIELKSLLAENYQNNLRRINKKSQFYIENTIPEALHKNNKIILYGAGKVGHTMDYLLRSNGSYDIVGWVDAKASELAEIFPEEHILSVDQIHKMEFDQIFITIANKKVVDDVKQMLIMDYGVSAKQIITLEGLG